MTDGIKDDAIKEETQVQEKTEEETEEQPEKLEHLSPAQEREALAEGIAERPVEEADGKKELEGEAEAAEKETEELSEAEAATAAEAAKKSPEKKEPEIIEKIIVDGQERDVPLSEIIDAGKRTLQKEAAADSRLEEATRILKEAKETSSLPSKEPKKEDEEKSIEDAEAYKEKLRRLSEAIQYGEGDEGEKALEEILEMGRQQATPDQKGIVQQVKNELRVENINEKLHASPEDGGFADIAENPKLTILANQAIDAELAAGKPYTWELCKKACQGVRDWVDSLKTNGSSDETEVKDDLAEKRKRKKVIDETKSANIKNTNKTKESKPQTASEIIAEMRKARGQA